MEGGNYIVSWCFGHLVELADASSYDERYAKWRYDDLPIVPESWMFEVTKDKVTAVQGAVRSHEGQARHRAGLRNRCRTRG